MIVQCPHCHEETEHEEDRGGKNARCYWCQRYFVLPMLRKETVAPPKTPIVPPTANKPFEIQPQQAVRRPFVPTPEEQMPALTVLVLFLNWLALGGATVLLVIYFLAEYNAAETVFQQCAACASVTPLLIAAYILARCVEKILKATIGR